uniref:Movement protein n=1 Tax=Blackberry chlorotic ringspot virus TaxID=339420 RepID=K0E410_9BROM|nr:movement protein [Blackberry chlorotic ringspot virus]
MALTPKTTALTFSADDEASLEKAVTEALAGSMELNMSIRRCAAFPATNTEAFLCELTTKETKTFIGKFTDKVRGRVFVDHAVIHLMYIPVILNTTDAIAELKNKNLATGDELYGGTKVNLNEAFILTMTWPRSLFADEVNKHKGLYLGGVVSCAPHVPKSAKIGMWYPMWTEEVSAKQLYQDTAKITNTRALETYTRTMISSDKEMRSLLRSRASIDIAAKSKEKPVLCFQYVNLLDQRVEGVDFTVKQIKPADVESLQLDEGPSSKAVVLKPQLVSTDTTTVDVDKPAVPASRNLLIA